MPTYLRTLAIVVGLVCGLSTSLSAAPSARRVLLLHSYHQGYEWTDDITRGIRTALATGGIPADLEIEYLDARHHELSDEYVSRFVDFLRLRHAPNPPDVIITADDPMVRLLFRVHEELFPSVPVIFCGVNEYRSSASYIRRYAQDRPWLAGVLEILEVERTASLALQLRPQVRELVTVGEEDAARYDEDLQRAHPGLQIRRLHTDHLTIEQVGAEIQRLPDDAIVLLSAFSRDATGRHFTMAESTLYVSSHSRVPVFGLNKNALGFGIVGGVLNDGFLQGRRAGEMVVLVLRGAKPSYLGVQDGPAAPEFDYLELQRWNISESKLPAGSLVTNRPTSLYARYKTIVWGAAAFMLLQSAIISLLVINITRRRRAQDVLAQREAELRLIIDNAPVFISYLDSELRYVRVNRRYQDLSGIPADDLVGRYVADVFGPENFQQMRPHLEQARDGDVVSFEMKVPFSDGKLHVLSITYTPDTDRQGAARGIVVLAHDVTATKEVEEKLARQAAELERSNADLAQFAYIASHDLQEPLRTMSGFGQIVRRRYRGQLDESADEFLDYIVSGAQRMEAMIRDLLAYSRVGNTEPAVADTVPMGEAVQAALVNLRLAIEDSQAVVEYPDLPAVTGDGARLTQLLQNLIGNAIKYRRSDTPVRITITAEREPDGRTWLFCVRDNGSGFNQEFAEKIFGVFKRLHGQEVPGTGIGLAICRKIVERHGGRIWAEGRSGEGARFWFTLRAARGRASAAAD